MDDWQTSLAADRTQLAEDFRAVQRTIADVRATADSADGMVSATVDGAAQLVELWLDPRIYRTPDATALAESITGTIHAAVEEALERAAEALGVMAQPAAALADELRRHAEVGR